jgi:uncharacterized RDD family membrane protein YckC
MSSGPELPRFPGDGGDAEYRTASDKGYASWISRVGGYLIDYVLVLVLVLAIAKVTRLPDPFAGISTHVTPGHRATIHRTRQQVEGQLLLSFAVFVYATAFIGSAWNATPGMRLLRLRCAREAGSGNVILARAFIRSAVYLAFGLAAALAAPLAIIVLVDLLWPLWDKKRQTLHDKAAGTVVLRPVSGDF